MLVIRMQRTGRKGHAMFRVIVQDSRRTPTSGKIVAALGSYDPHSKTASLNTEKAQFYLEHGAQPSDRAARLLQTEGVKLPDWVKPATTKDGKLRHADKLRRNQPAAPAEEKAEEPAATDAPAEDTAETSENTTEDVVAEAPSETPAAIEATESVDAPEEISEEAATETEPEAPAELAEAPEESAADTPAETTEKA